MPTQRKPLTTYVDEATHKWVLARAKKGRQTVSQCLAWLLADMAAGAGRAPEREAPAPAYRAPAEWPPPPPVKVKRMATLEDAAIGLIETIDFYVPLDWLDGEGVTRAEIIRSGLDEEGDGRFYMPPSQLGIGPPSGESGPAHD